MDARGATSPAVSVITPVFDPEPDHLRQCLESVARQTVGALEHLLVDDGSTRPDVQAMLAEASTQPHVRLIERTDQGGIVAATNEGLAAAQGEYVAFLDHDDVLRSDAVETMLDATQNRSVDVVYSDHDFIDADGFHLGPCLKPAWSPERLRNQNYITHFVMARRSLVDEVGRLRSGYDGAQDHDLMLRLGEEANRIEHVDEILYHWRQAPSSVSSGGDAKPWAFEAGLRAVADHCQRVGIDAEVGFTEHEGIYRVRHRVADPQPLVSVLIPTRGSAGVVWGVDRCFVTEAVRSIVERSTYENLEFVVIIDDDTPAPVIAMLRGLTGDRLTLVEHHGEFNFSVKMNEGAAASSGEYLLFLNDDTEIIDPASIEELIGLVTPSHLLPGTTCDAMSGDVGMAGAKLLFDDGTVQHGGHVYFYGPHHACAGWSGSSPGALPLKPLAVARECSGVTAAVAAIRRDVFDEVGGFPDALPLNYNDVDLSLRIRAAGYRIVWTPHSLWYHFESRTRVGEVTEHEASYVQQRWAHELDNDPYYNRRLSPLWFDWLEWPIDEPMQVGVVRDAPPPALSRFGTLAQRVRQRVGRG